MATTKAILFTDLVGSTELLSRIGQESMERVRREHFRLMREAIAETGGREIKTVGDAFMVAFDGASDAVRCGVAMQLRQRTAGRLQRANGVAMRVGVSFGELDEDAGDLFGLPVVEANRLCAACAGGQVLISDLARALARSAEATFRRVGELNLKGLPEPLAASEVLYELRRTEPFLATTPFVGREPEVARLREKLSQAKGASGGLVMLVGEPGIGKTRLIEELSAEAAEDGMTVIAGRCFEGDWAPPFGPFVEALSGLARLTPPAELRADMGYGGPPLARLAPAIAEVLPDTGDPAPLAPHEEQFRILDAVSQLLLASAKRAPMLLVLDDLHWADGGTLAMLRHVARFLRGSRILVLGVYRDVELDRQHPLGEALAQLRRESEYDRILLRGLDEAGVGQLLSAIAEQGVQAPFVKAISDETDGNPFFIRETLLHLVEEGKLVEENGAWRATVASIEELGIPEGVRQVIGRRLSRLSDAANRLLTAASAFSGPFAFDLAASGAGLGETDALDAVDAALTAQLIRTAGVAETYEFTHALIRHTLYREMNPSRQVRLHRKLAEAMQAGGAATAAEIAYQYHRSAPLPGAEKGVAWALRAAEEAESRDAWDQVVAQLRIAAELSPAGFPGDEITGRLGIALIMTLSEDAALVTVSRHAKDLFDADRVIDGVEYVFRATEQAQRVGLPRWMDLAELARDYDLGLEDRPSVYLQRVLLDHDEGAAADYVGIVTESPRRRELWNAWRRFPLGHLDPIASASAALWRSREEVLSANLTGMARSSGLIFFAGGFAEAVETAPELAATCERLGLIEWAVMMQAALARCHIALGKLELAETALGVGRLMNARIPVGGGGRLAIAEATLALAVATDSGWESLVPIARAYARPALARFAAPIRAGTAEILDGAGDPAGAQQLLAGLLPAVVNGEGWSTNYVRVICSFASLLWRNGWLGDAATIEANIRAKVVGPDFRFPMYDGRLSLARLCALQGRLDEARQWFAEARVVLEEQGARPLRAICDYDEALALVRDRAAGIRDQAFPVERRAEVEALLGAALSQFREIGMTGWIRRAEALLTGGGGP